MTSNGFQKSPDQLLVEYAISAVIVLMLPFPVYGIGRLFMWAMMPKIQYEFVLLSGHRFSIWLGGWALLAFVGFVISLWFKGNMRKAIAAACFGTIVSFIPLGIGIGNGASVAAKMSEEQKAEALNEARVSSHPFFWQMCCTSRRPEKAPS